MAVPVHLFLTDDGGAIIRGSSDVADREGSIELRSLHHSLTLPTDPMTGKITGTRQHSPFQFTKSWIAPLLISLKLPQRARCSSLLNFASTISITQGRRWSITGLRWRV
jgi:type VI secretion system secreted protein Hcp